MGQRRSKVVRHDLYKFDRYTIRATRTVRAQFFQLEEYLAARYRAQNKIFWPVLRKRVYQTPDAVL